MRVMLLAGLGGALLAGTTASAGPPQPVAALIVKLKHEDSEVRLRAVSELGNLGTRWPWRSRGWGRSDASRPGGRWRSGCSA